MDPALDFRAMEARESDLSGFRECFERNGTPRRLDALRWQYLENPTHELFVDLAFSGERIAATYAVQPAFVRACGARALAAQSVDTLVDADFRWRGLFTKMAEALYQRLREREGAFGYGLPNANSGPGFFNKRGWLSLDPVPFLVKPLRTAFLASKLPLGRRLRRLPDLRLEVASDSGGSSHRRLWRTAGRSVDVFASDVTVAADRSPQYLRWRLGRPGERYECLGVFEAMQLVAFCAYTTVDKHGGRIGYVIELLHDPGRHETGAALLVESLRRMATDGADAVLAWAFGHSPSAMAYSKAGFVPLPERCRPIELHVGVRPLGASLTEVPSDRRNWYVSYCASDTL